MGFAGWLVPALREKAAGGQPAVESLYELGHSEDLMAVDQFADLSVRGPSDEAHETEQLVERGVGVHQ